MSEPSMDDVCATCGGTYGAHCGDLCDPPSMKTPRRWNTQHDAEIAALRSRCEAAERERDATAKAFDSFVQDARRIMHGGWGFGRSQEQYLNDLRQIVQSRHALDGIAKTAEARVAALEGALKPFAEFEFSPNSVFRDAGPESFVLVVWKDGKETDRGIRMSDFDNARALLAPAEPDHTCSTGDSGVCLHPGHHPSEPVVLVGGKVAARATSEPRHSEPEQARPASGNVGTFSCKPRGPVCHCGGDDDDGHSAMPGCPGMPKP